MRHQACCCCLVAPVVLLLAALVTISSAEIPEMISYQGRVTDDTGVPVADGTYDMRFRIYDAETAGNLAWDSGTQSVQVSGGIFNVLLGETPAQPVLGLPFDEDYWLLVTFDGVNQTPRQRFASVGYAYMASGLVPGTIVSAAIGGLPESVLKVHNTATTGETFAISARHDAPSGTGIIATAVASSGENRGVYGRSYSTQGRGVYGYASANSGANYGGYFESNSSSGRGVYGGATATTNTTTYGGRFLSNSQAGRGVFGYATASTGTSYGGKFHSNSTSGRGCYGWATATTGTTYGGAFKSSSPDGYGVWGMAEATTGLCYGGYFETASSSGTGVRGIATSTTGETYGVYGRSYSTTDGSRGVYGRAYGASGVTYGAYGRSDSNSDDATGVFGYSSATGAITCGVYGQSDSWYGTGVQGYGPLAGVWGIATGGASGSGTGVFGEGPLCGAQFDDSNSSASAAVASDTYKIVGSGSVSFMQNHPQDNDRVIVYAAPEGDEVATYTRGTARLESGEARVALGETFKWVTNPDLGLTAHLTPREDCRGLYVASLSSTEMIVRELGGGTSDAVFDYLVYGLRIGFEEQSIVQEREIEAYIPSMASHRERYARHPDLRRYNALERFKAMRTASGSNEPLDLSASEALRGAIEEYDPAVHGAVESPIQRARRARPEAGATASPMLRRHHRNRDEEVPSEKEFDQTETERTEMAGLAAESRS